ncbi:MULTISPECIES: TetR/AcrR family transcriptional regulator C-terminal domain-containing protein [unclassified Nocardia]|uniref:TetR/AcrR family transcriptional regulator C-terminal domain-containing protein n=1 Tax=unclassified Nocardia TaxID=2637762 RepID=UPI001CE3D7AD|nr:MULTISPECIES: TetR/AcrR family transcriptional regulator C-terminal domain-containing protein [unclassified Nocardia]
MPRPKTLTDAALADAALAVIDASGLSALTMRAVAQRLGMATMSLYRYVPDRDALEVLVVDRVFGAVDPVPPNESDWRIKIFTLLDRMRAAVSEHSEVIPLLLRHRQAAASTRTIEAMLAVLTEAGFTGRERVIAQRTLIAFLLGHLNNEHYAALSGPGTAALASLPAADYPHLTETAAFARTIAPVDEFRAGAEIVLRGLVP